MFGQFFYSAVSLCVYVVKRFRLNGCPADVVLYVNLLTYLFINLLIIINLSDCNICCTYSFDVFFFDIM